MARRDDPIELERTFRFLRGLKKNNDRTWFHAHREDWDGHIRHGWEDLVTTVILAAVEHDDRLRHADPRACLFRIANDTRFHKQRDPYKPWLSAWMSPGGKSGAFAGYYLQLAPGESEFSAGIYTPEKDALRALRATFAADGAEARAFDRITRAPAMRAYGPVDTDPLRVTPRGFPRVHPRLPLIRARNYMVRRDVPDAELRERGVVRTFRDAIRATAPFVRWLDAVAGTGVPAQDAFEEEP